MNTYETRQVVALRSRQSVRLLTCVALVVAIVLFAARAALAEGPKSVADLADKLSPAVVNISTSQKVAENERVPIPQVPEGSPFREFFEEFFNRQQRGNGGQRRRNANSLGSGFVIDANGIVITNNHVIDGADEIEVIFSDGKRLKAKLRGKDSKTDLAVLEVQTDEPLPFVEIGTSSELRVGDWVMAIGNPFGLGGSVTLGIVSAMNRNINAGPYDDFIQTDAAINRGNSGGPLFDMNGKVVGVNTAIISPSGGSIGIGFAVPSDTASSVIDQLLKFGETRRGWLGVRIQTVTDDLAESLGLDETKGALVADVTATSPAEAAGIKAGDVIVSLNDVEMKDSRELSRAVGQLAPDTEVTVGLIRKGEELSVLVKLGRLETGEKLASAQTRETADDAGTEVDVLGMKVAELTDELREKFKVPERAEGSIIVDVADEGPAADARLRSGDIISEIGDKKASAPGDVAKAIEDAENAGDKSILVLVLRAQRNFEPHFIPLKFPKKDG